MSYIRKYLNDSRNFANERYMNADGGFYDDFAGAEESFFNAEGDMDAPAAAVAAPTSQPYIITVSNSNATAVSNFDVLGSYTYLQNTGFTGGSLTIGGVTISSAISNVNYQQFLYQTMNSPYTVGLTYIESVAGSASQVSSVLTLNTQDANGNQALKPLIPVIDPYQFQSGTIALKQTYRIDGFTKITIATILPSVVFRMHFYPADNINIARGLSGRSVSRQYSNPKVIKDQTVVVKG
jgi:hypothetical protein